MKIKILEILTELRPEYDFAQDGLDFVMDGMLDSFDIVSLVDAIEENFGVAIAGADIVPENFATIEAIEKIIGCSKKVK